MRFQTKKNCPRSVCSRQYRRRLLATALLAGLFPGCRTVETCPHPPSADMASIAATDAAPSTDGSAEKLLPAAPAPSSATSDVKTVNYRAPVEVEPAAEGQPSSPALTQPELPAQAAGFENDRHHRVTLAARVDDSEQSGSPPAPSIRPLLVLSDAQQEDDSASPLPFPDVEPTASPEPTPDLQGNPRPVDYFVRLGLQGHPAIRAARQRVAAEVNRIPQVSALPDPTFNNTFWPFHNQALQTAAGRIGHQMSLSQAVPYPEKLRTKAAIASREVQIAQAEVDRLEREVTESIRLAYYEVWYATRALEIVRETQTLIDDLIEVAEARYRSGGTQQDVLRAQLEQDRLDDQMVVLQRQKESAQADLAALVQQPLSLLPEADEEIDLAEVPQQLNELIASAEQCNPELRGLAWEIQRDRQKQRLACLQKVPDLQFGLNWALVSDDTSTISPVANGHDNVSFTIGTTLPIYRSKINAGIREAAFRTRNSVERLEAERDTLYGRIRRLLAQADALVEQREIYQNRIIPRTEDTLELAIADYRGERTDFFTLIETYRELLMFETQWARINATLAGRVAQIERAVGCPTR